MERQAKSNAKEKSFPNWLELPREVTISILDKLSANEILEKVQWVCTQWNSICKEPSLWRTVTFKDVTQQYPNLNRMFKQGADRTCGGLIELDLIACCTDEFLIYITRRNTQLRRLRVVHGFTVSSDRLREAAKSLPLLEDLELSFFHTVIAALRTFGKCCPLLKSLKVKKRGERYPLADDKEAMAIAKNMPELRHLQLFGNQLTNRGLKAILDSCSHLESLDIRQCFNVDLQYSSLGKTCAERIKDRIIDFRGPYDSTADYEHDATVSGDDIGIDHGYDIEICRSGDDVSD